MNIKLLLSFLIASTIAPLYSMEQPPSRSVHASQFVDQDQFTPDLPGFAKKLCIACAKEIAQYARKHSYSCNHEIHAECFAQRNHFLENCYQCKKIKDLAKTEDSSSWWPFAGKKSSSAFGIGEQLVIMQEELKQLKQRSEEILFHERLLEETQQTSDKKRIEFQSKIQEMETNINHIVTYLVQEKTNKRIECGSWLVGGATALIAYNQKYTVNKSVLIGLGTGITTYVAGHLFNQQ